MKRIWINDRWPLTVPDHRADRPQWPWWEATRLAAMYHIVNEWDLKTYRPVVFDIGAEEGDFPALYATWGCNVALFEPNPKVWPNIRAIFNANELDVPQCFVGLASDETTAFPNLVTRGPWPRCAFGEVIGDHGFINLAEAGDTPQIKIDDAVNQGPFILRTDAAARPSKIIPDIITIDTEGSELRVLQGAMETLEQHRPIVFVSIHPEFMVDMYDDSPSMIHKLFEELGYHSTFLTTDHEEHWMFHPDRGFNG